MQKYGTILVKYVFWEKEYYLSAIVIITETERKQTCETKRFVDEMCVSLRSHQRLYYLWLH